MAEQEKDVRDMIQFLVQLSDRATGSNGSCKLHICLSSRHYPHITISRGLSLVVEDQPEHGRDIELYITRQLTGPNGPDKTDLQDQILAKSNRVFLWVVLIVEILSQLEHQGSPLSEMKAHLKTIPTDLNKLFREILAKTIHSIETSILLFQWIVFAQRSLEPTELYMAMEYGRSPAAATWTLPAQTLVPQSDKLKKYVLNCSRGLVEIVTTTPSQPPVVQFIHETVREFLLNEDGLASILSALASNLIGTSHEILHVACCRAVSTAAIPQEYQQYIGAAHNNNTALENFKRDMRMKLPFLDYAISYLLYHMEQAQMHKIPQESSLEAQIDEQGYWKDQFRCWWNVLERYKSKKIKVKSTLLYTLIEKGYFQLVPLLLNITHVRDNLVSQFDDLMHLAVRRGQTDIVSMLLNDGAKANVKGKHRGSGVVDLLYIAADQGFERIVEMLLNRGADVNAQGGHYGNALQAASAGGHSAVIQLLQSYVDQTRPLCRG